MKHKRTFALLLIGLGIALQMPGQDPYELMFLKKEYQEIIARSSPPGVAEDYYWQARALGQTGGLEQGIKCLQEGLAAYPEAENLEMLLADFLYNTGDYAGAKPLLVKYSALHDSFMQLVRVLEFQSKRTEVICLLNERMQTDPTNIEYIARLADNYYQADSLGKALSLYEQLTRLNPRDQAALTRQANILLQLQQFEAAIAVCDRALAVDSTNMTIQRIKGIASFRDSDFRTAARIFLALLVDGDTTKATLKHLGISEIKNFNYHDAREHLLIAFRLDSLDHEISFFLGRAFLNSTMPDSGLYYLERADSLLQPDPEVLAAIYTEKVSIYGTLDQYEKAIECYEKAYALSPKPEYLFFMASLYRFRLEDKAKALTYYSRFLGALPPAMEDVKQTLKNQGTISMKKVAEESITALREELFFEGALKE
jgi:tetratricopeptide (TPR) repeat protein